MSLSRLLILSTAVTGSLLAQVNNDVGFTRGWTTSYTTRANAGATVADVLNHFDSRNYTDWMLDPADPTGATYKPSGVRFVIQDQVGTTTETYGVSAYNEDPLNAEFPDASAPWFTAGPFNMPTSTATGAVAWIITVTLPATTPSAPKGDKWIGMNLSLPATGTWPADGVSLHATYDRAVASTSTAQTDVAGLRIDTVPNGNFVCTIPYVLGVPTGPASYPTGAAGGRLQLRLEVITPNTGGVAVTHTNQTWYPSSNPVPTATLPLGGTTNFISGLHPDVYDGNLQTPSRADNIGFLVTEANIPSAPVFVMIAFGGSPLGSQPLLTLFPTLAPTSRGNVCVDFTTAAVFFGLSDAAGLYQHMLSLDAGTRLVIQGMSQPMLPLDFWYQGFVLNVSNLEVRATGCAVQHL